MTINAISTALLAAALLSCARTEAPPQTTAAPVKYGANTAAGSTFMHDGVELYYEIYGDGEPLLLIHPNGANIAAWTAQIDHFRKNYKVIAMDSRDQGRSADSPDKLTYEKMTDDLAALLDHLQTGPVNVLGWSDGGIEALLLGIRHPAKVKKIAAMAANLYPKGLHPDTLNLINTMLKGASPSGREAKVTAMMLTEPQIQPASLEAITAPTLVLAADHDAISDEHTLEIYHHIPNAVLNIFPGATHMIPYDDPATFNAVVERFFREPYVKKDRINDLMKSLEAMQAAGQ